MLTKKQRRKAVKLFQRKLSKAAPLQELSEPQRLTVGQMAEKLWGQIDERMKGECFPGGDHEFFQWFDDRLKGLAVETPAQDRELVKVAGEIVVRRFFTVMKVAAGIDDGES